MVAEPVEAFELSLESPQPLSNYVISIIAASTRAMVFFIVLLLIDNSNRTALNHKAAAFRRLATGKRYINKEQNKVRKKKKQNFIQCWKDCPQKADEVKRCAMIFKSMEKHPPLFCLYFTKDYPLEFVIFYKIVLRCLVDKPIILTYT